MPHKNLKYKQSAANPESFMYCLERKHPHKNIHTGEIKYFSYWELYNDRQKEVINKAIIYGQGMIELKLNAKDWKILEETPALRTLYGPKEK